MPTRMACSSWISANILVAVGFGTLFKVMLFGLLVVGASATLAEEEAETEAEKNKKGIAYQVVIEGVDDDLRGFLEDLSSTKKEIDDPPTSLLRLKHQAKADLPVFEKALRSRGFYDATTEIRIDSKETPVAVVFQVNTGQQYHFSDLEIRLDPEDSAFDVPAMAELGLEPGKPAWTQTVLDGESKLLENAKQEGYALASLCKRTVTVDHSDYTMAVEYCLKPGPKAYLGEASFSGADNVDSAYLETLIPWEPGELYQPELIDKARQKLIETRLFVSARVRLAEALDQQGRLPVTFELIERKPHTVSATLRATTDIEIFIARLEWEHRNLWRAGESLETNLQLSAIQAKVEGTLRKPAFFGAGQSLLVGGNINAQNTDAFESLGADLGIGIERVLREGMLFSFGLAYRFSRVKDKALQQAQSVAPFNVPNDDGVDVTENFSLLSIPARFSWDFSDDLMDPNTGGRLRVDVEPFTDVTNTSLFFFKQRIRYSHYFTVVDQPRVVLAGRISLGDIWGAGRDEIPSDERFYAGGGGSIRGYGFQKVSPLNLQDTPIGGRSLIELSGEVRWWVTDTIGLVVFVDAGRAYDSEFPDFNEPLQIGAGPGIRYKTPIGPIRFDVGFPINKRSIDDSFQVYISIGQAF